MALLTPVLRLVVALGTVGPALARQQLPPVGATDALVGPRAAARLAAHVAAQAEALVAVVAGGAGRPALAALQLKKKDGEVLIC